MPTPALISRLQPGQSAYVISDNWSKIMRVTIVHGAVFELYPHGDFAKVPVKPDDYVASDWPAAFIEYDEALYAYRCHWHGMNPHILPAPWPLKK